MKLCDSEKAIKEVEKSLWLFKAVRTGEEQKGFARLSINQIDFWHAWTHLRYALDLLKGDKTAQRDCGWRHEISYMGPVGKGCPCNMSCCEQQHVDAMKRYEELLKPRKLNGT